MDIGGDIAFDVGHIGLLMFFTTFLGFPQKNSDKMDNKIRCQVLMQIYGEFIHKSIEVFRWRIG